jgi:Domain of unknown function (DUF4351)
VCIKPLVAKAADIGSKRLISLASNTWVQWVTQQGVQRQLVRVLQQRFGEISAEVRERLQSLGLEQLENLTNVAIAANSLDEFTKVLLAETQKS